MKRTWGSGLFVVAVVLVSVALFLANNRQKTVNPAPEPSPTASALQPLAPSQTNVTSGSTKPTSTSAGPARRRLRWAREPISDMSPEEREAFDKKFAEKIKPAVEQWCNIYQGHLPFRPEDVTADKLRERAFPDRPFQGYSFVVNGTTVGVRDDHGKISVDYLMSAAANDLFRMPKSPAPPQPMSVTREEILRLIKADSGGQEFPPDQIAIRPTSASGAMNGGVSVDVGEGVNASFMPLPKFGFVFDPQGKLACYLRGLDTAGAASPELKTDDPAHAAPAEPAPEPHSEPPHRSWIFTNATSITLVQEDLGTTNQVSFTITNAADVARISRSVHLEADPVGRRWDLHSLDAIFQTPAGRIEVQFCNECLDVVIDSQGSTEHYKMPTGFYKEVWNEVQKRPQKEQWAMEPP